jgi:hypothetical protein
MDDRDLYDERDYAGASPNAIKRAAVEGATDGRYEFLAGASNDPEGNATEFWLERRTMADGLLSVETTSEEGA